MCLIYLIYSMPILGVLPDPKIVPKINTAWKIENEKWKYSIGCLRDVLLFFPDIPESGYGIFIEDHKQE